MLFFGALPPNNRPQRRALHAATDRDVGRLLKFEFTETRLIKNYSAVGQNER